MLRRTIEKSIEKYLQSNENKIFFIWGPRRSGKTTLLKKLSARLSVPIFNFDFESDKEKFLPRREVLAKIVASHKVILIDEVQNYPQVTISLKILHDEFRTKIIATGSSELRRKSEKDFDTLAGRYIENFCLPFSVEEIADNSPVLSYDREAFYQEISRKIQIFGAFPEVYVKKDSSESEKIDLLQGILETYVLKDIINIYDLKNARLAKDILTKIALQLGSEVSLREIANSLEANVSTVSNYIEIFIKNYILISLPSFKTNARRAVSENRKLYFYDLGIRNILVKDFRDLDLRPDRGGVFENFIVSEIAKSLKNLLIKKSMYFYREYGGREVDIVLEDYHKKYTCLEVKIGKKGNQKDVFPLPHQFFSVDSAVYFDIIAKAISED